MTAKEPDFPDDTSAPQRREKLTGAELEELALSGGVEGGMQAGSGSPRSDHRPSAEPQRDHGSREHPAD